MSSLKIRRSWLGRKRSTYASELDATFCRLEILINEQPITEYVTPDRIRESQLQIPLYYLAEWIAENWWALLNEPRKNDQEGDNPEFLARHSFTAAQHGFPLPSLLVVPVGKDIHLFVTPRSVPFAEVKFVKSASAFVRRSEVESELASLVDHTLTRLREWQLSGTPLEHAWTLIRDTAPDEEQFCRLVGALGLSPYDVNEEIENTIEAMSNRLGERELRDLCLASTGDNLVSSAETAVGATEAMANSPEIELQPLNSIQLPSENPELPGYRRGVQTASRVRAKLGISETDPHAGDAIFELLKMDPTGSIFHSNSSTVDVALTGAVARADNSARMILLQGTAPHRRFTAARAVYLAWSSERQQRRFVTNAVTRDQQSSRAFAAELLAPIAYIKSQRRGSKLPQDSVYEIASRLRIGPDVVLKQALNNGVQVAPI